MANSYKDIIITPNRANTADPKIEFRGANTTVNTSITIQTYPTSNGTLSFEGSAGQLFSITNDLTGSIFSVNDVSGIPSIEVFANGQINMAPYSGTVSVGGSLTVAGALTVGSFTSNNSTFAYGKQESQLSVAFATSATSAANATFATSAANATFATTANNALRFNGKQESQLFVANAVFATTAGSVLGGSVSGTVATANNATFAYGKQESQLSVATANNATFAYGRQQSQLAVASSANATFATTANNALRLNGKQESQLYVANAVFATTAGTVLGGSVSGSVETANNSLYLLGRTWSAAGDIAANTLTLGISNVGGTTPIKTFSIVTNSQAANNVTYELGRISRDVVNWSFNSLEITVNNLYYRGGMSRWVITYNQIDAGTVELIAEAGTIPHKLYLGNEVTVAGNIRYRPILIDLPAYTIANIEMKYKYNEVASINASSQLQFTGIYTTNASATGTASTITSITANNSAFAYGKQESQLSVASAVSATTAANATFATTANNALRLNGKQESQLSVASAVSATTAANATFATTANNALRLNGKQESQLSVAFATSAGSVSGSVASATTATFLNTAVSSTPKDDITTRTNSGFWETPTGTTAEGWPINNGSYQHLISATHSNGANYYSMQLGADFYTNALYYRSTNGSGTAAWSRIPLYNSNFAGDLYATRFYDANNTAYYADPASTSIFNSLDIDGIARVVTSSVAATNTTRGLIFDGNYTNGQYRHRFRKQDNGGGVPLFLDYAAGTADSYTALMKFGPNTADGSALTVYGIAASTVDMRAPIFYDSDNTSYFTNPAGVSQMYTLNMGAGITADSGSVTRVTYPGGATFTNSTSALVGAIKVTLPVSWTNTMMSMRIRVFNYNTGQSFEVHCGGYNYSPTTSWINTFAYIVGQPNTDRNFNIRFGHDGTKCCIVIGEVGSSWSYVKVVVEDVLLGHSNFAIADWDDGWAISTITTLPTVTSTINNAQVGRYGNIFYDSDNTGFYIDPSSTTNINDLIITRNIASPANYYADLQLEVQATSGTAGIGLHRAGFSHCGIYHDTSNVLKFNFNAGTVTLNHDAGTLIGDGNDTTYVRYKGSVTSEDWNTYIDGTEASYRIVVNGSGSNRPGAYMYGVLLSMANAGQAKFQLYAPHNGTDGNGLWVRTGWDGDYDAWNQIAINSTSFTNNVDLRAPIFYDSDNTAFYGDFASGNANAVYTNGGYSINSGDGKGFRFWNDDSYKIYMSAATNATWGGRASGETTSDYNMYFRMSGGTNRGFVFRNGTTNVAGIDSTGRIFSGGGRIYLNDATTNFIIAQADVSSALYLEARGGGFRVRNASTGDSWFIALDGVCTATADFRAPIFYDSNNTAYYLDPNSTSNLLGLTVTNTITGSITGNAGTATNATNALRIVFNDGPRNLSDRLPNSFTRTVNWDFVGAGTGNGVGNYAGVMTFAPWAGTTASTGDSSYQLAFANQSGVNASGPPRLSIRSGIDTTWGAWYILLTTANYNTYSPTLTGTGASGTWGISITGSSASTTGNAATATALQTARTIGGVSFNGTANINLPGVNTAGNQNTSGYATYLPTRYDSGVLTNPQQYFGQSIGLRVAMTGTPVVWADTLWINGYAGGDVLSMCALHFSRQGTPRMWITTQQSTATAYGTAYEFPALGYNSGNTGALHAGSFVDSNDTAYFSDPAGRRTTSINGVTARTKMTLGLTSKYQLDRADFTADTNYWIGTMGWGTTDMNDVAVWGSGFIDSWSSPANAPSGTSHWVGIQAYHATFGAGSAYGWQLVGGPIGNLRFRQAWPSWTAWRTVPILDVNDTSGGAMYAGLYYDSNDTTYYCDPNSISHLNDVRANIYYQRDDTNNRFDTGVLALRSTSPTVYFRDTDHNSAMLHCNSNIFYILRGGNDTETWATVNGYWPLEINLTNNTAAFGGIVSAISDMRAPIFYDTNNTARYLDPNGSSYVQGNFYVVRDGNSNDAFGGLEIRENSFQGAGSGAASEAPGINFHWSARAAARIYMDAGGSFVLGGQGDITNNRRTLFCADLNATGNITAYYSDDRLKTRIGNIENALDIVSSLNGFRYVDNELAKTFGYANEGAQIGVSAQEVQKYLPEIVRGAAFDVDHNDPDHGSKTGENYLTVDYSRMVPLLIEAIKEQQAHINRLEEKINLMLDNK